MGSKSEVLKEEVLRLYAEGQSVGEILELVNMSYDRVLRLLKKEGVYRSTPSIDKDTTKKRLLDLIDQDKPAIDIYQQTNIPLPYIYSTKQKSEQHKKVYKYAGKQFNSRIEKDIYIQHLRPQIQKLFAQGISKKDLATKFNISTISVSRLLN